MKLQRRFDYKPLERIDTTNGRRYLVNGGHLPSVTTILSSTKDMSHLEEWRENVGADKADKIVAESSHLGSEMHNNIENNILGKSMSGTLMARILANLIIKKGLCNVDEVWGTEISLYSENLYAGTTDLVGTHYGIPSIIDFKNSLRMKQKDLIEDYFLQLVAYGTAHNEMYGTDIRRGVIMMATRDAKYQEFIIEDEEYTKYETMWVDKLCVYYNGVASDK